MNDAKQPLPTLPPVARYDRITIALHWIVVVFVIGLYGSALIWDSLPRGPRKSLEALHVSFGLLFVVVLAWRVYWRLFRRAHLPEIGNVAQRLATALVHNGLYIMLVVQAVVGVCWRIAQQEPLALFGLFAFPEPLIFDKATRRLLGSIHEYLGHTIAIVAALHALAALYHQYVLKDGLMQRMRPLSRSRH